MKCVFPKCSEQAKARGVCPRHAKKFFRTGTDPNINPVKAYREKRGISQAELALKMGVLAQTVGRWEMGHPPPYVIFAIYGLEWVEEVQRAERDSLANGKTVALGSRPENGRT